MKTAPRSAALYQSPWFQAVAGPTLRPGGLELTQRALSFCGLPPGARVADIGCGTGATLRYLREHGGLQAVGLDRSSGMLVRTASRPPNLPLVNGRAECLPFGDCCMAAVFCECVLSLVADPDAAWREIQRVLAPGGLFVLADIYAHGHGHPGKPASPPAAGCLEGAQPRDALVSRMHRFGFRLLVWEDHSELLKRLAARLVFACGSLEALRALTAGHACREAPASAPRRIRGGYFLSVARKGDRS